MESFQKLQTELQRFGLSPDQAKIYLCLAQEGELRIQDLVKRTRLPRSTVYEHLKTLFRLGLAEEVVADNYKKILPYPISALKHDLSEKILDLRQLENDLDELEKTFVTFAEKTPFPSMSVRYYKDVAGARQVLWNSLKAEGTIHVYSAWGRSLYVGRKFYENFVEESKKRALTEKVLINPRPETLSLLREHLGTPLARTKLDDIRAIKESDVRIIGETFIYDDVFAQVYLRGQEINGFEIESRHFIDSQTSIFKTLWELAEPVQSLL